MLIVATRNRLHINLERREGGGGSEDGCVSFFVAVLSALIIPALPDTQEIKLELICFLRIHLFMYISSKVGRTSLT